MCKIFLALGVAVVLSCSMDNKGDYHIVKTAWSNKGMVVSAHPLASAAGVAILERGGNAIDAMVATQLALAVVYPRAGNIGGGGFMVYRAHDGNAYTLDYREKAPGLAGRDMYLDSTGNVVEGLSRFGQLAAGVPGTIAGLEESHRKLGRLEWPELCEDAITLARKGFRITKLESDRLNQYSAEFSQWNDDSCPFVRQAEWRPGDLLVQKDLAATLERIAQQGSKGFYEGPTANAIVQEMESGNGIITAKDLLDYRPQWRDPLVSEYDAYTIISMPPPSSGGIALVQMLEMIEPYDIDEMGFQTAESIHLMAEAERRAYADRSVYLGDADFVNVPVDSILDPGYLTARMADYTVSTASLSDSVRAGEFKVFLESYETTHLSVADADGNVVSATTTLNSNYGCKVMVDEAGFFLNNEMDDFSVKPGVPNQYGLIGNEANAIAPGKRMLSSMTPTIVEKNGEFFMTLGTPGGATIITSVFQGFINVTEFGMSASEATAMPRFHHQWLPDEIVMEDGVATDSIIRILKEMGHDFRDVDQIGSLEIILRHPDGRYEGAADPRRDDHAAAPE